MERHPSIGLGTSMILAAASGGMLAGGVIAVFVAHMAHITGFVGVAVVLGCIVTVIAMVAAAPFAFAVSWLYGDQPLARHPAHRVFWCILAWLFGLLCGAAPVSYAIGEALRHAG